MSVAISNPWWHIGAGMLLPLYVLFLLGKRRLKTCSSELNNQESAGTCWFYFRSLRWHLVAAVVALGIVVALVVGSHRLFVGVETGETEIVLDYPWPRSDVRLRLQDISEADVECSQFGIWGRSMFRLRVRSPSAEYWS